MQANKENLLATPKPKEIKKRPSLQSPFSAASPNTRPAPRKLGRPLHELGDQNLDATSIAEESNISKLSLSESLIETPSATCATSSAARVCHGDQASEMSAYMQPEANQPCVLAGDGNLEESALLSGTFTISKEDDSSIQILCDTNLEETAADFTLQDSDTTRTTIVENDVDVEDTSICETSANTTLTNHEADNENTPRIPCDANLEETSIESTFYQTDGSVIVTSIICKDVDRSSIVEDTADSTLTNAKEFESPYHECDSNLEESVISSIYSETIASENTTITIDSEVEPSLCGTTFTIDKKHKQIPADSNLEISAMESTIVDVTGSSETLSADADETLKTALDEEVFAQKHAGDSNLEETCLDGARLEDLEQVTPKKQCDSIRVFVEAKASPLSANDSVVNQGLSLANELGELGVNLDRSSAQIKVTASGNVSILEKAEEDGGTCSDSSRYITSASTAVSESKIFADTTKCLSPANTTQYGDISMDITACSFAADDTMAAFTPRPPESKSSAINNATLAEELGRLTAAGDADSFGSLNDDTMSAFERGKALPNAGESVSSDPMEMTDEIRTESDPTKEEVPNVKAVAKPKFVTRRSVNPYAAAPLSPIADLSRSEGGSRASTVRRGDFGFADASPVTSQNRKYNMNDSEISFLMHENRIYDMALRNAVESPEELEQMRKNISQLEKDKADLHEKLRSTAEERNAYKASADTKSVELGVVRGKLAEITKAKENAEKTVADYEFIVEDLKKRHNNQKQELFTKVISLEEELETCRAQLRTQTELSFTSAGLATELNVFKERLLISEEAQGAAEKRCEDLVKELELAADRNLVLLNQIADTNEKSDALQKEIVELHHAIAQKESAIKEIEKANANHQEIEKQLEHARGAASKAAEEVDSLKKQLEAATNDLSVLREVQTSSELELIRLKDDLSIREKKLEEANAGAAKMKNEKEIAIAELKEKSQLFAEEQAKTSVLAAKLADLKEERALQEAALVEVGRETERLQSEKNILSGEVEEAKSKLSVETSRAEEAEKKLKGVADAFEEEKQQMNKLISKTAAEKADLETRMNEADTKMIALSEELEKRTELISRLEESKGALEEEAKKLQSDILLLVQECEEKTKEVEQLNSAFAASKKEFNSLQEELTSTKAELAAANEGVLEAADAKRLVDSLRSELDAERAAFATQLNAEKEASKKLLEDMNEAKETLARLREEKVMVDDTLQKVTAEKAATEKQLQENDSKKNETLAALQNAKNTMAVLGNEKDLLRSEVDQLKADLEMMERKHSEEISGIHKELAESEQKLAEKEAFMSDLVKECESFAKSDREQQERVAVLQRNCEQLRTQLAAAKESAKFNRDDEALKEKVAILEREIMNLKKEKEVLEQTAEAQSNEVNELKQSLAAKDVKIEHLEKQCDELDEIEEKYQQQIYELTDERDALKAQIDPATASKPVVQNLRAALTEGIKPLTPDHSMNHNEDALMEAREKILELESEINILKMEKERLEKIALYSDCDDVNTLKRELVVRIERIEYLEKQCDEIDELEEGYRQQIDDLTEERDRLLAQLHPTTTTQAPPVLIDRSRKDCATPESQQVSQRNDKKVQELEQLVKRLEIEKKEIEDQKLTEINRFKQQNEKLREQCDEQRKKIEEFVENEGAVEKERVKKGTFSREKEDSATNQNVKKQKGSLLEVLRKRSCDTSMEQSHERSETFESAPSSPTLPSRTFDSASGLVYEESVLETVNATPNRTLHTTLYKKLDKTAKLTETPNSNKKENSRCTPQ
ncbi:unnamed protein product [Cylicocyclus nassatus]|uniref:Uncharacterized protein n=1 Tax=Cylicocyclus nassatus TaxID=53992 RepID=A0AA36GZE4_CYLNA|nr:unnamed protein product [Cylicocyclus nassatus]